MRESARPTGVSLGRIFATPISSSGVNPGACVDWARKHATCGKPMPTTTVSPSFSSRAPAATMISVARMSLISIARHPFGFQRFQMLHSARFLEIVPMILGAANVAIDVVADLFAALGMFDIQLEMRGIIIVAAIDGGRMRAPGLVNHGFHPMGGNDGALRLLPDDIG